MGGVCCCVASGDETAVPPCWLKDVMNLQSGAFPSRVTTGFEEGCKCRGDCGIIPQTGVCAPQSPFDYLPNCCVSLR